MEDTPNELFNDRPCRKGNNPNTAVWQFLKETERSEMDHTCEWKALITVAPDGVLKCIKEN